MKIKAKNTGGVTKVKTLIKHPMHTGMRKNKKTGEKIPAKYIQTVTATHGGKTIFTAYLNTAVSKDPFLSFSFKGGNPGDTVSMSWSDSTGGSGAGEAVIK